MNEEVEEQRQRYFDETGEDSDLTSFPWTEADVRTGVLERVFMLHLLEVDPCVRRLVAECNVSFESLPDLARGSLLYTLSVSTLKVLKAAQRDYSARSDHCRAWLIGQTNHWISVFSGKLPKRARSRSTHETIVCDSRNNFVLTKSVPEIEAVAAHRMRHIVGDDAWTQLRKKLYLESLHDVPFSTELLHHCCTGQRNSVQFIIEMHFDTFFNSYSNHTAHAFDSDQGHEMLPLAAGRELAMQRKALPEALAAANWLPALKQWLADFYPAPVIETNICGMLERLAKTGFQIPPRISARLKAWRLQVSNRLKTDSHPRDKSLSRLRQTLRVVDETLDVLAKKRH